MPDLDPSDFTVAWIAPLAIEADAATLMLDGLYPDRFEHKRGDDYVFLPGHLQGLKIIIATLPVGEEYGTGSAAAIASQVKSFFPNIWFGLLVGVAAGLPNLARAPPRDIRLGDVLVAVADGEQPGLVAYDLGKDTGGDLELLHSGRVLAKTERIVRSAITSIQRRMPSDSQIFLRHFDFLQKKVEAMGKFVDPGQDKDKLYDTDDKGETIERTRVWYGSIGSGDKLMKNARNRDRLRDRFDLIGLEMEAAGTMNQIPVGVIRGVCDYADKHKNKDWQPYAAAMAAAYAKAVLLEIIPKRTASEQTSAEGGSGSATGRPGGPVFHGPISGRNVMAGWSTRGNTNQTFN
ncbi:uncharacterized protein VDAG_10277 [Verticillium dahliae VdLs.17]|uniref:Nucleoside phosphorylase domain-containing protein n=1 Tax=Verticillium dahliae (strain VdLs.17 / ATCC MYA-4575 / FGSC 10137) TaxID=498257 RepID=G2XJL4_VERDV|nr:uncharacterized protein VDAG_10277 [Verticillium dahliae VdLs.17]EGY20717.1 hypothetical protein VDAG_10277 [Verticillium dahliae VdLs.17]KAF3344526.1 putative MFS-type transporter [Verticillium dahliae VDG2]KAH6708090.1 nucleoside phosphorylase domain-containing protein [Verticillium dahliae]